MQLTPQRLDGLFGRKRAKLEARWIAGKKPYQRESDEGDEEDLWHQE